jgi:prepilin-type N-terminal cleavage/methylation domain-containing protein
MHASWLSSRCEKPGMRQTSSTPLQSRPPAHSVARAGFTVLEAMIAIAVLAMLAAAAIPVATRAITSSARKSTRVELVQLGSAARSYFRDTSAAPRRIRDFVHAPDATGWAGPYLPDTDGHDPEGSWDFASDAWSHEYRLANAGDVLTITSAGPDAALDTRDDVRIHIDFTPIRRAETLAELEAIQRAVELYDEALGAGAPLCADWSRSLAALVDAGFLSDRETYATDAWGNPYVGEPVGREPLVLVVSTSISIPSATDERADAVPGEGSTCAPK